MLTYLDFEKPIAELEARVRELKETADSVMLENTELFQDTIPVLSRLKQDGAKMGIVTTKFHYRIDAILAQFHIQHLIDGIVGNEDVENPKPHPEGLLRIIKALDVPKDKVLYVGDSIVDARAAQSAEVDFAGVLTGTTTREMFSEYPYKRIMSSLSDLLPE
jgi:phosphoglycolate phosphatase